MNYGLYMAASGMSTSMARQNALSNNLANVATVGYKPDNFAIRQRAAVRQEDGLHWMDSNEMLEKLGAGVQPTFSRVEQSQGPLTETNNPFHIAVQGDGFLQYERGNLEQGFGLSRDGRPRPGRWSGPPTGLRCWTHRATGSGWIVANRSISTATGRCVRVERRSRSCSS